MPSSLNLGLRYYAPTNGTSYLAEHRAVADTYNKARAVGQSGLGLADAIDTSPPPLSGPTSRLVQTQAEENPQAAAPAPQSAPLVSPAPAQGGDDSGKILDFQNDPIGSIGLLLGNIVAGYRGDPLPTDQLRREKIQTQLAQQEQAYKQAALGLNIAETIGKQVDARPQEAAAIVQDSRERFGKLGLNLEPVFKLMESGAARDVVEMAAGAKALKLPPEIVDLVAANPTWGKQLIADTLKERQRQAGAEPKTEQVNRGDVIDLIESGTGKRIGSFPVGKSPNAPSTNIAVHTGNESVDTLFKASKEQLDRTQTAAISAVDTLNSSKAIRDAMATGKVSLGPGTSLGQFMRQLFGNDPERAAQTRAVVKELATYVMAARKQFAGQGSVSVYEQQTAEKANSADIDNLSRSELGTILTANDHVARLQLKRHDEQMDKTRKAIGKLNVPGAEGFVDLYSVEAPPKEAATLSPQEAADELKRRGVIK